MDPKRINTIGTGIPVPGNDIDTDRIIPARFMKCVTFDGLEKYAFYDVRFDDKGNEIDHPFNDSKYQGGAILIVNKNFGCGSSREHAPQALMRFGMKGIIGETFAEIFAGNCTALGIPAVRAGESEIEAMQAYIEANPGTEIDINLENKTVTYGDNSFSVDLPESARQDLVKGSWDTTAQLLANSEEIKGMSDTLPYMKDYA